MKWKEMHTFAGNVHLMNNINFQERREYENTPQNATEPKPG